MFYRQKMYKLRKNKNIKTKEQEEILEVGVFPITPYEKNKTRKRKKKEAIKTQKNLNDKNAKRNFYRKAQCNFDHTDYIWHITFKAGEEPKDYEDARRVFKNLISRVNTYRKKQGLKNTRYMGVVEGNFKKGNKVHFHILIDGDVNRDKLETFWKSGYSNIDRLQLDEKGIFKLTKYMMKDPKGKRRWIQSKGNLEEPQPLINDNRFSRKKMREMLTNQPSREEIEDLYPGYTLTDYTINYNEENGGVYMQIFLRRTVIGDIDKTNRKNRRI